MGKRRDGYTDIWSSSDYNKRKKSRKKQRYQQITDDMDYRKTPGMQEIESDSRKSKSKKKRKDKHEHPIRHRLFQFLILIVFVVAGLLIAGYFYIGPSLNTVDFPKDKETLGIDSSAQSSFMVENIALFGVDSRDGDDTGRSDTMIVISLDKRHHKIKLTSILRDSRVEISGHGMDKLCHAYAYGGPELAVATLNENYHLDIREYVTVNFDQLAQIIDAIGGVTIDITEKERVAANGLIASTPSLSYSSGISRSGTVHLNGAQAVAYSRIRKIDNETERAARQQTVLQAMIDQIQSQSILEYPKLIKQILPYMETSLSYHDLVGFLPIFIFGMPEMMNNTVPNQKDPDVKGGKINGIWYWTYDLDDAADAIHEFIYKEK